MRICISICSMFVSVAMTMAVSSIYLLIYSYFLEENIVCNCPYIFPKLTLLLKLLSFLSLTKYMWLFLCIKTALLQYIHILFAREKHELILFRQIFTISSNLSSRQLFHLIYYSSLSCIHSLLSPVPH